MFVKPCACKVWRGDDSFCNSNEKERCEDMFHRVKSERQPHEEDQKELQNEMDEQESSSYESSEDDDQNDNDEVAEDNSSDAPSASNLDIPPGTPSYQRGFQSRPAASAGSASGFGASSIPAAGPSGSETTGDGESRLTIGRGITMSGEIEACDYLLVEGTVEAALKGARALDIAESGTFYGTVEIDNATVAGRFEGDLTVSGRLTVRASGVITGTISYSELAVEAGAVIEGALTPMSSDAVSRSSSSSQSSKEGSKGKKGKRPQPANSDGQLFKAAVAE